jgi:ATP-dependent exoDNAse (exonuclease V) beta subunit
MMEHNGKMYARVSDIIKPFVDFSGIDEGVLNRKAALGTRVHEAIQQEIEGEMESLPPSESGYLDSWKKWRSALCPEFVQSEKRYFDDRRMITGCIDALIKFPSDDRIMIVDWKTSASESPVTWTMQAHLYFYLACGEHPLQKRFLFVKLDRYGNLPQVFQYIYDQNLMARCMTAIEEFWQNHKSVAIHCQ